MANNVLVQTIFVALSLIVSANNLDIGVQPEFVHPGDKNVVFTCAGSNDTKQMLEKMLRMRLMKLDDDDNKWSEVAVLRFDGSIDLTAVNATAVGRLADVLKSYLAVTWPVAPDNIHGRYRCDAIALTSSGDIVKEKSGDLEVKSVPGDMSLLLENLKKYEKKLVGKINETMHRAIKFSKINLISVLESKFGDILAYLDNRTAITVGISRPEEEMKAMHWPVGNLTLLMPSDGCPLHPPAWSKSFLKVKEQPGDKYFPIDAPLHLANPHKRDGFIYRQFCTLPATPERTQAWPEGSYCLFRNFDCPVEFKHAIARVLFPSDEANFYQYYFRKPQISGTASGFEFHYCCRHDGSATNPIDLPVSHPFYLFRHGGRCQEVKGMDVTQDVFMVETMDEVDFNVWADDNLDFHPDISFLPYKEELCYYSRSRL